MQSALELLAPARNKEIGIAAIDCGADAVYMAGSAFGARSNAGNNVEDIADVCTYARLFGAKVYVTVNTILYDTETDEAFRMMEQCREAGCDAFIIQDMAIPAHFRGRKDFPPFFASTQCAIRTPAQAEWLESLGMERLILERELTLEQVREIRKAVSADLEFFVHGALCVCYSGNCYLSEYLSDRSANRGECIQACRSRYDLADNKGNILLKDKALLSLKDLSLINRIDDLIDAGISSFKIEGRLKNSSYVKNTVKAYSMALDRAIRSHPGFHRQSFGKTDGGFAPDLDKTFNRGYTELALDGAGGNWSSMDNATAIGEKIGKAESITAGKGGTMKLLMNDCSGVLHNGDGLCFIGPGGVTGFRADVCQGRLVTAKYTEGVGKGTEIYRNYDIQFEKELENNCPKRLLDVKTRINIRHAAKAGNLTGTDTGGTGYSLEENRNAKESYEIEAVASCENGKKVTIAEKGNFDAAENRPRMEENFARQMNRTTGVYSFSLESVSCDGTLPFLPASAINALRRSLADRLDREPLPPIDGGKVTQNDGTAQRQGNDRIPELEDKTASGQTSEWQLCRTEGYKLNCSNSIAAGVYKEYYGTVPEKAYELTHRKGAELMRSRYCIKRELGLCPRFGGKPAPGMSEPLFLVNNGRRLRLIFDCARCEMVVTGVSV